MRRTSFILLAVAIVALLVGAVGVYAYDSSKKETVANGVTIGGVDVGGLSAGDARAKISRDVAEPLRQPVVVKHRRKRFELGPGQSRVRPDVEGMVDEAIEASRGGNMVSRTFRGITGGEVEKNITVDVKYSRPAVTGLVKRVKARVDRPAKDATVSFEGGQIARVPGQTGRVLKSEQLKDEVERALVRPGSNALVANARVIKPKVSVGELEEKYPTFIRVDRNTFKLHLYKRLKLTKTYTIALGQAGFDTPAGLYHVQNKAENAAWSVPNKPWAGDLAGRVIPGGAPDNPLKARWMGFFDGAGIHGTDQTASLGTRASHGCVRMAIPDVKELYEKVEVGAPIYIG